MAVTGTRGAEDLDESLAAVAVRRRIGGRQAVAEDEVRRLLAVGLELTRGDPSGNPKIADIVRIAGVSNDAFYRAFRSKDDLMAAIVDDGARRLISYVEHMRDKAVDPIGQVRGCIGAILKQAADPEVAATSRAVFRHAARVDQARVTGSVDVRRGLALLLVDPLARLGSPEPTQDALVAAGAIFAAMETFLWAEQAPTQGDADHLLRWLLRASRPD
jgi:AcrR family transcriptional regulator